MFRLIPVALIAEFMVSFSAAAFSENSLSPAQASSHVGETATVCGAVAGTKYAENAHGAPTFINLDVPYPHQVFTALVWGESRGNFSSPPESIHGRVCVNGQISLYRGIPQIVVTEPSQISKAQ